MLKQKNYPIVLHDDNGTFLNKSFEALSYGRDSFSLELVAADDYLYFGRVKPVPMIYVEMGTANTNANDLTVEYYNGTTWVSVEGLIDDTKGFTRSGAIQFDLPDDSSLVTVNSLSKHYIRIKPSADFSSGTTVQGINIVFSDDKDLEGIYPSVGNYKASTETSFILRHEAVRNDIVQAIRNRGFIKKDSLGRSIDYDAWDFLDYEQVGRWATYLAMANIFSSLQSKEDGLYKQKTDEYSKAASDAEQLFYLTLDKNDDGKKQPSEQSIDISSRRVLRS